MAHSTRLGELRLTGTAEEEGFLSRLAQRIIAARQQRAQRAVNGYLLSLDDRTLAELGYDRRALERNSSGTWII